MFGFASDCICKSQPKQANTEMAKLSKGLIICFGEQSLPKDGMKSLIVGQMFQVENFKCFNVQMFPVLDSQRGMRSVGPTNQSHYKFLNSSIFIIALYLLQAPKDTQHVPLMHQSATFILGKSPCIQKAGQ